MAPKALVWGLNHFEGLNSVFYVSKKPFHRCVAKKGTYSAEDALSGI